MGKVVDLQSWRQKNRPSGGNPPAVACAECGERHPFIRFADGRRQCLTAFFDGERWFCRNRGCRAAWLSRRGRPWE